MKEEEAKKILNENGQEHLILEMESLDFARKESFLEQISEIDWDILNEVPAPHDGNIEPLCGIYRDEIQRRAPEFRKAGEKALRQGKAAAVMLAGGQGTRLGSDAPKGTYDIGITKHVYIFERLIRNLSGVLDKLDARAPLLIMTSVKNDAATKAFLKEHDYFGYLEEDIFFFTQEMAPATDFNGKILLEEKGKIAYSPNGNGGWFSSMKRAGLAEKLKSKGVEWLNVFAVDNVLQHILDPVFLGATIISGEPCGAKIVKKNSPQERVGVLCKRGGFPDIIEYYELDEKTACFKNERGELLYADGVILNYLFRIDALEKADGQKIPVHRVKKKMPYLSGGKTVTPDTENAYKYETLILDLIRLLGGVLPFEVEREKEFAPVKNKTGIDSVESARELLKKNGIEL